MDDSLTNIDLIYDFALALNASIEQQVPELNFAGENIDRLRHNRFSLRMAINESSYY